MKAVRKKCLDCSGESAKDVELCPIKSCTLWPFRFGKRPATAERKGKSVTVTPDKEAM